MKKLFIFYVLLFYSIILNANDIKGRIIEQQTSLPIEFASATLLKNDSTFVANGESDNNGLFEIKGNFVKQDYILRITYIGFATNYIRINNLEKNIDLGDISLISDSQNLDEVTVTANKVINKVDRQIILPSKMEIESSTNGFDMLNKMFIPGLIIDPINKSIKSRNQNVQLRINGIRATIQEVQSLIPNDISRVEYFDEPGVRFGDENVGAVVNFIVTRTKESGAYIAVEARNAPFIEFGDDRLSVKANHKASQFSLDYSVSYRGYDKRWSDGNGTYNFPNNTIEYRKKGIKEPMSYQYHDFNLAYNLTKADKYTFNVSLKDQIFNSNQVIGSNILYTNDNIETAAYSRNKMKSNTPSLDIYYRQELKNKQSLAINVVGTYIGSDEKRNYNESREDNTDPLSIFNKIDGDKYSIIGEVLYNKEFENNMILTLGGKHTQGYTENKYRGNTVSDNTMKNAESYVYAQLQGKFSDKLKYSVGIGGSRVWFKEDQFDKTYFMIRPSLRLSYSLNDEVNLRYSFNVKTSVPSLGFLSNVEQRVDSFFITRGNPDLKPYNTYTNRITVSYNKAPLNLELNLTHTYMHKPYMNSYSIEDLNIISSRENYKNYQVFSADISGSLNIIKDIWTVNAWFGAYHFSDKNSYDSFKYNSMTGGFNSNLLYKNFTLLCGMNLRYNELWGQSISYGEKWSYVEAGYKYKEAKLALGMSLPFDKYWSGGSKNLSKIAPSKQWTYIKENSRMIYLSFSYNISFGRKYSTQDKKLNNSDSDRGVL